MYKSGWMGEKWRLLGILLLGAVSGLLSGQWLLCFLICISCYALWHLKQLRRVEQWLRHQGGEDSAPVAFGLWNELINHIYRLHKRHDKILQHQNKLAQRFEQTAQATPDATIVIGQHGDIRWANTAAERYIGIRNPGDIGVRLTNLIRDPEFAQFINQASADSSININSPVDSNTHLNVRMVPYRDGEYLLTARDISELIRADAMRRDFISNASHELKTPLTVMMGYLELLESEPGIAEDLRGIIHSTSEQTIRMRSLVDDLLTLSRLDNNTTPRHEMVRVAAMLESIVEDARQISGELQHQLHLQADPQLQIEGSYQDLISAFSNLVFNAVLHTPAGTEVNIRWQRQDDYAVLSVQDKGPGIPSQHLNRLTERFYRVQAGRERSTDIARSGRGTGLGLAITKHVVQAHNGYLEIQSEVGKGSEFTCFFSLKSNN